MTKLNIVFSHGKESGPMGSKIKCNPAIKRKQDRDALLKGLLDNHLDIIATDHAPHTKEEKANVYTKAPSGGPLVQHALVSMLEAYHDGKIKVLSSELGKGTTFQITLKKSI